MAPKFQALECFESVNRPDEQAPDSSKTRFATIVSYLDLPAVARGTFDTEPVACIFGMEPVTEAMIYAATAS